MRFSKFVQKLSLLLALSFLPIPIVVAEGMHIVGTMDVPVTLYSNATKQHKPALKKIITLLKIELSPQEKSRLIKEANALKFASKQPISNSLLDLPTNKQLGMNNVPVLDQGYHGTCATFALTGALDATIGKGNYVSQICSLQFGNYLEQHGYGASGWDGQSIQNLIQNYTQYGIVNVDNQRTKGCGGYREYPAHEKKHPTSFMEPATYNEMSEKVLGTTVNWSSLYYWSAERRLLGVKEAIAAGNRPVFSLFLPRIDLGVVGAVGRYKTVFNKDTWVLTPEILKDVSKTGAGHAMIITGYDDDAVATDPEGHQHKGLLKLRNSWGTHFGDSGDFYMSYDYFKLLTNDVIKLY